MLRQKRTRPSSLVLKTTSQMTITQKHSLELMKTIITATSYTLGSVGIQCHYKIQKLISNSRVFPKITYKLRSYDPADPEISYNAFVEGVKGKSPSFEPSENLMIWKILPRSQDPAVDKVLDCLEIGAFDALKQGYLSKLQVSLHSIDEKPVDDSNLIESYTMIFEYDDGNQLKVCSKLQNKSIVIQSAKKSLYELVNDVGFLIHHINRHRSTDTELPEQFRMLLSLMYNDKASENYQPPMFRPGNSNSIKILESGHPNPNLRMKTGFHSVTIGVHIPENNQLIPIRELPVRNATPKVVDKPFSHEVGPVANMLSPKTAIASTQVEVSKELLIVKFY
ncbi:putative Bgh-specific protein [Blumeria hordei DH14]|uniref:Putative Bgh-specific protein n=1 Tax=Blumeria graminis f. sp. hordei (strain DH14) TaxID=546991 RepID=N1J634_BLUG1|nr:putative Bgh-specific protein [Blumeria hordei DH14]